MTVRREIWEKSFINWPLLPCPKCDIGSLRVMPKNISIVETGSSKREKKHEDWAPDWVENRFSAMLICANPSCREVVSTSGKSNNSFNYRHDDDGCTIDDVYTPSSFEPSPPIFPIPKECPKKVEEQLKKSFSLFWSDIGSCANRLRIAVEALLNERGVSGKAKIKNGNNAGKMRDLSLHERIERFGEKNEDASKQLMAIKWLGNAGSHYVLDELNFDDIMDAFDHFEYAIDLVYSNQKKILEDRAEKIIKKKGSVRKANAKGIKARK